MFNILEEVGAEVNVSILGSLTLYLRHTCAGSCREGINFVHVGEVLDRIG
jgi:hypothetical protein